MPKIEFGTRDFKRGRKTLHTLLSNHGTIVSDPDPNIVAESLRDQSDEQLASAEGKEPSE